MSGSAIDSVLLTRLEAEIGKRENQKSNLDNEIATLTAIKEQRSKENNDLRVQQEEEETKLGAYKLQMIEVEKEALATVRQEQMALEAEKKNLEAILAKIQAREEDLATRESVVERTAKANEERAASLKLLANDLEARENQCIINREDVEKRGQALNVRESALSSREQEVENGQVKNAAERTTLQEMQARVSQEGEGLSSQREQALVAVKSLEQKEEKIAAAHKRLLSFVDVVKAAQVNLNAVASQAERGEKAVVNPELSKQMDDAVSSFLAKLQASYE